jgi:hypothetical protein
MMSSLSRLLKCTYGESLASFRMLLRHLTWYIPNRREVMKTDPGRFEGTTVSVCCERQTISGW